MDDKAPIDFWFDFSSPYAYLLSERIDVLERMKADSNYQLDVEICKKTLP